MKNFEYKDGLYQSVKPILVDSLERCFDVWFDVSEWNTDKNEQAAFRDYPTTKQMDAWQGFCSIAPDKLKNLVVEGLLELALRLEKLPSGTKPGFGPTIPPETLANRAKKYALAMRESDTPLAKQSLKVFQCDSIVIPNIAFYKN